MGAINSVPAKPPIFQSSMNFHSALNLRSFYFKDLFCISSQSSSGLKEKPLPEKIKEVL